MIDNVLNGAADFILDGLNNYLQIYKSTMPKFYKRKIRYKHKIKYQHIYQYNPLHELLPNPKIINMALRHILIKNVNSAKI